ncbi:hypothetical protein Cgig2_016073 [Carnegiea gigantea]|uniref:Uncharacterized protein n=1 Tax=Carnegiea gigantea TaxID=171969 RepID=A0A9Q1JUB9_9CARY|nr:hypothetical protein Cgig2_016073 [Carnegiea gigantea]
MCIHTGDAQGHCGGSLTACCDLQYLLKYKSIYTSIKTRKGEETGLPAKMNLSRLGLNATTPFLFSAPFILSLHLLLSSLPSLKGLELFLELALYKTKGSHASGSQEEVIFEVRQFVKLVQRLPITRLGPPTLGLFPYTELASDGHLPISNTENNGPSSFLLRSKWTSDQLPIVPMRKVPPTHLAVDERAVVRPVLQLGHLFNGCREALAIVKAIPADVPGLTRGLLDRVN